MTVPTAASIRFGGIIPIQQIFNTSTGRLLNRHDHTEGALFNEVVRHMEELVKGDFPYSRFKAPRHVDVMGQQALINEASGYRDKVLARLRLIDPDFANDPHQRLAALTSNNDCILLTGDDAQPILDADRLQDSVLDKIGTDAMANRTPAERAEDARILDQVDAVYSREEARVNERVRTAARHVELQVVALPGSHSFWGQVGALRLGVPPLTITDLTVC
jgi:hypothetical protein